MKKTDNVIKFPLPKKRRVKPYYPQEYDTPEKKANYDAAKAITLRAAKYLDW